MPTILQALAFLTFGSACTIAGFGLAILLIATKDHRP